MLKFFKSTDKKKPTKPAKEKMGCGASAPKTADTGKKPTAAKAQAAPADPAEPQHPDNGLKGTHELIKFLGRGGTGDTYLFRDKATAEEVAIKLMKRPLPAVIRPNILREIRVCLWGARAAQQSRHTLASLLTSRWSLQRQESAFG